MQNPKKKKKINTEFCSKKKVKTQLFIFTLVSIFKIQNKKLKKKNTNSSLRFLFFFARNVWKYFHKTCNQTATSHLQIVRGKFIEIKISLSETKKKKNILPRALTVGKTISFYTGFSKFQFGERQTRSTLEKSSSNFSINFSINFS